MPRKPLLPSLRRSTFRAPDPAAAARFDLALPGATTDDDRLAPTERAELSELRTESLELALVEQHRLVEERMAAELELDRAAASQRAMTEPPSPPQMRTSFPPPAAPAAEDRPRHPRHRADRIGNRRPTSGAHPRIVVG